MFTKKDKKEAKTRRHFHIRSKVSGTATKPRLTVFKSNKYISCQIIDDETGCTLASATSQEKEIKSQVKNAAGMDAAKLVGEAIADRAKANKIETVVFDRSGYLYHGKVKMLADSAREKGLNF